jgi:hypothetical protein
MKYRKKPVVIEAVQWNGLNDNEIRAFASDGTRPVKRIEGRLRIQTLEGAMFADPEDWIIKGVKGECYPCKPDIFEATYEAIEEEPTNEG